MTQEMEELRQKVKKNNLENTRLTLEVQQVQAEKEKIAEENVGALAKFELIKKEKERFEVENNILVESLKGFELDLKNVTKKRDKLKKENSQNKAEISILKNKTQALQTEINILKIRPETQAVPMGPHEHGEVKVINPNNLERKSLQKSISSNNSSIKKKFMKKCPKTPNSTDNSVSKMSDSYSKSSNPVSSHFVLSNPVSSHSALSNPASNLSVQSNPASTHSVLSNPASNHSVLSNPKCNKCKSGGGQLAYMQSVQQRQLYKCRECDSKTRAEYREMVAQHLLFPNTEHDQPAQQFMDWASNIKTMKKEPINSREKKGASPPSGVSQSLHKALPVPSNSVLEDDLLLSSDSDSE